MDRLERAGWGELAGRSLKGVRLVLHSLARLVDPAKGTCLVTAPQLADRTGMSDRWVRVCLHRLEAAGIVSWRRGWLDRGRCVPGFIRVSKAALWALIPGSRTRQATVTTARARATRDRIRSTLRLATQRPRRCSSVPELSSTLPPTGNTPTGGATATPPVTSPRKDDPPVDNPGTRKRTPSVAALKRLFALEAYWLETRRGTALVVNPNECGICHRDPHPTTRHHAFEPAQARPDRAAALGWPMPPAQPPLMP